ncbi:hypothetical protein [Dictyobacter kobayashii]|uniref:KOW domain-containing protein n=1 Tax=Dictyobacter kobayashii TaxID=2014872 RepID=A0A402AG46_9CHLR|nr:hypothetical protein [Dictyobacter kobayashii]GCE18024.1 hypothetical protein KDK_18240 [Dictyobacter kobayashii]
MTYPSGWSVLPRLIVKRERWPGGYHAKGIPLVYRGQEVVPDQPVLRLTTASEYDKQKERASTKLSPSGISSSPDLLKSSIGQDIPAGLHGRVVGVTARGGVVIESHAALIQGILGAGKQAAGVLTMWQPRSPYSAQTIPPGAILVVPGPLTFGLLHQALNSGVVGVVASSIALRDLEGFLRTDYLQLLKISDLEQAQEQLPPLTLLLTEGIGSANMPVHTMNLLTHYQGTIGLLAGATSLTHNLFPELVISIPVAEIDKNWQVVQPDATLALGAQVRVCSGQHQGAIGIIDYFYSYEQTFTSGLRTRSVRLRLDDGSFYTVPITLIERIS